VQSTAQYAGRKVKPRTNRKIATPLPRVKQVAPSSLRRKAPVFSNRQIVNPVPRKLVPLVEARKAAVGGEVEGVLRHHGAAAANRGGVVNRLGIEIGRASCREREYMSWVE